MGTDLGCASEVWKGKKSASVGNDSSSPFMETDKTSYQTEKNKKIAYGLKWLKKFQQRRKKLKENI